MGCNTSSLAGPGNVKEALEGERNMEKAEKPIPAAASPEQGKQEVVSTAPADAEALEHRDIKEPSPREEPVEEPAAPVATFVEEPAERQAAPPPPEEIVRELEPQPPSPEPEKAAEADDYENAEEPAPIKVEEEAKQDESGVVSEETSDATRKAEAWTFSTEDENAVQDTSPAALLKAACMKFRPQIMRLPGVRGIRVKNCGEKGPVVILRIRHMQPDWTPEEIPEFMRADTEHPGEYLLVDEEGGSIMIGEFPARIRVVRKRSKVACLAEPENVIGTMEGGCLKGAELPFEDNEEPAEPLVVEGHSVPISAEDKTVEEEAQPPMGVSELAADITSDADKQSAEAATEQPAKGEEAEGETEEVTQPTDI